MRMVRFCYSFKINHYSFHFNGKIVRSDWINYKISLVRVEYFKQSHSKSFELKETGSKGDHNE